MNRKSAGRALSLQFFLPKHRFVRVLLGVVLLVRVLLGVVLLVRVLLGVLLLVRVLLAVVLLARVLLTITFKSDIPINRLSLTNFLERLSL